jgi:hypothetical protein
VSHRHCAIQAAAGAPKYNQFWEGWLLFSRQPRYHEAGNTFHSGNVEPEQRARRAQHY